VISDSDGRSIHLCDGGREVVLSQGIPLEFLSYLVSQMMKTNTIKVLEDSTALPSSSRGLGTRDNGDQLID
jgi:hypothetical protein